MVAQYADVWNSTDYEPDVVAHKLDVLQRHCDTVGRASTNPENGGPVH